MDKIRKLSPARVKKVEARAAQLIAEEKKLITTYERDGVGRGKTFVSPMLIERLILADHPEGAIAAVPHHDFV
jgi:hypothetical protein